MKAKDVKIGSLLWRRAGNWILLVVDRVEFLSNTSCSYYWNIFLMANYNLYEDSLDMYEELK